MAKPLMCPPELLSQNLTGRVYVVTGGNSGIGLVTVQQLAKQGATVVLACRRPNDAPAVAGDVHVMALDLADLSSVRAFSAALHAKFKRIDGLVNNAGVMNTPQGKTKDGFELQFGTNHLGHYLLTELLLDLQPARIVNLSSVYHEQAMGRPARIDLDDLNFERKKYDGWSAYGQSKLANLLHARALAKRGLSAVSVHPGWVRTNLISQTMPRWIQDLSRPILRAFGGMIEPWEGAQTSLFALLSPTIEAGDYYSQTGVYQDKALRKGGWPLRSPNPQAHDDALVDALDKKSRELLGLAQAQAA